MKVRTRTGNFVNLSPLQVKILIHCISHNTPCDCCWYDDSCTYNWFIQVGTTPNGVIIPKNFNTHIHTNNYRKQHNLPKKRKGADYFD